MSLDPPPSIISKFNHNWIQWLSRVHTFVKSTAIYDNISDLPSGDLASTDTLIVEKSGVATKVISPFDVDGGAVTKPLQPAFLAIPSSIQTNITINTDVIVIYGTERFDQSGDFASNVLTSSVTGKYQLDLLVRLASVDIDASSYQIKLVTSNRSYVSIIDPNFSADLGHFTLQLSILADMDAGDTAFVEIRQAGGAAQTDIQITSHFSGHLAA